MRLIEREADYNWNNIDDIMIIIIEIIDVLLTVNSYQFDYLESSNKNIN